MHGSHIVTRPCSQSQNSVEVNHCISVIMSKEIHQANLKVSDKWEFHHHLSLRRVGRTPQFVKGSRMRNLDHWDGEGHGSWQRVVAELEED